MIMDDRQFLSIGQMQNQIGTGSVTAGSSINKPSSTLPVGENSFANILKKAEESVDNNIGSESLKFSKHAVNRLSDRNIELTKEQMARLEHGKIEASEKGIKDSLILIDQLAFIVNVPNNTVVTAMDQTENKSNVFTNIDGAVIA
ncbi:flagellar operon protein [Butyrivibrio sp. INlla18]|uniref:TIGR02530 family flagellar biosynthesis protein n=1 Tax=Butyrivibrio sp. INlla18 TaxID=1520806 RepID=UPI00087EF14D|nr:TIGR02530 family flagellar biosynthesis protein [Butyrivibrio sp. INlla18]SDA64138.1 flagellar operon protein [Butyrivibrio sp. INlla18]